MRATFRAAAGDQYWQQLIVRGWNFRAAESIRKRPLLPSRRRIRIRCTALQIGQLCPPLLHSPVRTSCPDRIPPLAAPHRRAYPLHPLEPSKSASRHSEPRCEPWSKLRISADRCCACACCGGIAAEGRCEDPPHAGGGLANPTPPIPTSVGIGGSSHWTTSTDRGKPLKKLVVDCSPRIMSAAAATAVAVATIASTAR